ncbi:MAG: hypothetical protein LBP19_05750 [Treponema sp.]|jgi:hypothetical protein|nr:hypothetical protein [Treponema sp.]
MWRKFFVLFYLIGFLGFAGLAALSADDTAGQEPESGTTMYTVFVNIVPEQFRFPLIGFVNLAWGSHTGPHIGFVNWNQKNMSGLQIGFVNTNGGDFKGVQTGFVNTNGGDFKGVQIGFVNTSVQSFSGLQLGFINYIEELDGGVPLGFISYVKNGGYKAVEYSVSEISPINVALKLGVEKLYTSISIGYNPLEDDILSAMSTGVGLGSIIRFNESFFFNPELIGVNSNYGKNTSFHLSLTPYVGYKLLPRLTVVAGPSVSWKYEKEFDAPFFHIVEKKINERNRIYLGARVGIRYEW